MRCHTWRSHWLRASCWTNDLVVITPYWVNRFEWILMGFNGIFNNDKPPSFSWISMWVKQCYLHHPWLGMVSWYHLQKWWFSWRILHQYVYNLLSPFFFANLQDEVGKCWETQKSPPDSPGSFIWKVEKNLDIDPKYGSEDAIGCQKFAISIVLDGKNRKTSDSEHCFYDWIGCVGKIYRKPWFLPSNIGLSCKFSHHPILCFYS